MLKTNSKQARENLRAYALNSVSFDDYGYDYVTDDAKTSWATFAKALKTVIYNEKVKHNLRADGCISQAIFKDWLQGLPFSIGDYYYNVSAVEILGDILEETETERAKYSETEAAELLTRMLYREIILDYFK